MILSLTILAAYLLFFGVAADQSLNYLPLGLPAAAVGAAGAVFSAWRRVLRRREETEEYEEPAKDLKYRKNGRFSPGLLDKKYAVIIKYKC